MMDNYDFLPCILELDGGFDELYEVFSNDFKRNQVYHDGEIVFFDRSILPDGREMEEGFWHVITRKDKITQERLMDYPRAERLPWASPLMQLPADSDILIFDYKEGGSRKATRRYIWFKPGGYLLVLQKKGKRYFWITAFYVSGGKNRKYYEKKYENRI